LVCYLGSTHIVNLQRVHPQGTSRGRSVNYRHVINSLARKPQAFRYSRLRDELLPNDMYKQIWEHVDKNMESRKACKFIVGLLHIAAEKNCEEILGNEVLAMIAAGKALVINQLQTKHQCQKTPLPTIDVEQHPLASYDQLIMREVSHA